MTKYTSMRAEHGAAEVGDDVHDRGPTVNKLEQRLKLWAGYDSVPDSTIKSEPDSVLHTQHGRRSARLALPCSIWEMAMVAGISGRVPRRWPVSGVMTGTGLKGPPHEDAFTARRPAGGDDNLQHGGGR